MHEASMHEENSFVTLTYAPEHLPAGGTLVKDHFKKYMKRLRRRLWREQKQLEKELGKQLAPSRVRYYHCGEYGEKLARPHYHACLFGYDYPDRRFHAEKNGSTLYTSDLANKDWKFGNVIIGELTFESAAYTARYITKKQLGDDIDGHYDRVNYDTGEFYQLEPEYTSMSLKPGIGLDYYQKYRNDFFPSDSCIVAGTERAVPRYYGSQFEVENPEEYAKVKEKRKKKMQKFEQDQTPERLKVREQCAQARLNQKARTFEGEK